MTSNVIMNRVGWKHDVLRAEAVFDLCCRVCALAYMEVLFQHLDLSLFWTLL